MPCDTHVERALHGPRYGRTIGRVGIVAELVQPVLEADEHIDLVRLVIDQLAEVENERLALLEIKRALDGQRERDNKLDEIVKAKIASLSRKVPYGSPEWDVLYRRYMEEEHRKQKS